MTLARHWRYGFCVPPAVIVGGASSLGGVGIVPDVTDRITSMDKRRHLVGLAAMGPSTLYRGYDKRG